LSGSAGIGKTTTAHLVARECGYDPLEFNAGDARNKSSLQAILSQLVSGNRTMGEFYLKDAEEAAPQTPKKGGTGSEEKLKKVCVIMDEVDGMSSGDRGGMAELILAIKQSKCPIICICNDRSSDKVKSLANYCLDLRFRNPTIVQATPRVAQIAKAEGFTLDANAIETVLEATQGDIRQTMNLLQMWRTTNKTLKGDESMQHKLEGSVKEIDLGPFDVAPKLFKVDAPAPALFFEQAAQVERSAKALLEVAREVMSDNGGSVVEQQLAPLSQEMRAVVQNFTVTAKQMGNTLSTSQSLQAVTRSVQDLESIAAVLYDIARPLADDHASQFQSLHTQLQQAMVKLDAILKKYQRVSITDRIGYYFVDSGLIPLLVQENYISQSPMHIPRVRQEKGAEAGTLAHLETIAAAADSISDGDLVDHAIRRHQAWELSNEHALLSSVKPASLMSGNYAPMMKFPTWLGKFSQSNKRDRLLRDIHTHMGIAVTANTADTRLYYLPVMKERLALPLVEKGTGGIEETIALMDLYGLTREDFDGVMEISQLGVSEDHDVMKAVPSQVKSAFTRTYNAGAHMMQAAPISRGRKKASDAGEDGEDSQLSAPMDSAADMGGEEGGKIKDEPSGADGGEGEEEQEPGIEDDKLIKKGKAGGGGGGKKASSAGTGSTGKGTGSAKKKAKK